MDGPGSRLLIKFLFVIGMASFLFLLADAAISYSDNKEFCLYCHSMQEPVKTFMQTNHKLLKCTDCHAPHEYLSKVAYKTRSGLHDLSVTISGDVPQVLKANAETVQVIKTNCIRCHFPTVENISMAEGRYCTDCHNRVGHNKKGRNLS